jgi:DNA-binding transcriptional ArsR family regulator
MLAVMSKVQRFLNDDGRSWTIRELAERLGMTLGVVRRQLRPLVENGQVVERRDGDRWVYQAREE